MEFLIEHMTDLQEDENQIPNSILWTKGMSLSSQGQEQAGVVLSAHSFLSDL